MGLIRVLRYWHRNKKGDAVKHRLKILFECFINYWFDRVGFGHHLQASQQFCKMHYHFDLL